MGQNPTEDEVCRTWEFVELVEHVELVELVELENHGVEPDRG